jgi:hypothetical protein
MECTSKTVTSQYIPPPIGNGQLSVMVDMEGIQRQKAWLHNMTPMIWWAGRRYETRMGELIPFGYIGQDTGTVAEWRQTLDPIRACTETDCTYEDGRRIRTEAFVHLDLPVLAVRKTFSGTYTFTYTLAQPGADGVLPKQMRILPTPFANGVDINYEVLGQKAYHGRVLLFSDCSAKVKVAGNRFSLTVEDGPASFFLVFVDTISHSDVARAALELREKATAEGFDGLFASHCASWADYWDEGYVRFPEGDLSDVYNTAQYHLRISTTPWSIPTGIFATHWHGKYFGFDEHFCYLGLATSGHLGISRNVPEFRHKGLPQAIHRAFSYFKQDNTLTGARYHWETDEHGGELAPSGFWLEHIFHTANIALSSWYQYRFTGDREFLAEKGYPVISRCADFYRTQHVYEFGERVIIGKCTDLERLGAGRENAYMTTCSAITTFEAAANAARVLGIDEDRAERWQFLADKLRESLPQANGQYVPYPNCPEKSVAVFAGTFPYPAVAVDDPRQERAIADFMIDEKTYGNMYPVGNSVCVWYAGWMGIAFARLGQLDRARICIEQAIGETNCFHEIFEISSPAHHPWFTTAEGSFVQLVNECLIQSTEGEIRILPWPEQDYAFKLPAIGGMTVEASIKSGQPEAFSLTATVPYTGQLILPDGTKHEVSLAAGESWALG